MQDNDFKENEQVLNLKTIDNFNYGECFIRCFIPYMKIKINKKVVKKKFKADIDCVACNLITGKLELIDKSKEFKPVSLWNKR